MSGGRHALVCGGGEARPHGPPLCTTWRCSAQHQRQGHGRAAFQALEARVQALGLGSIGLHVFAQNVGAQALYRSLGFGVTGLNMLKPLPVRSA